MPVVETKYGIALIRHVTVKIVGIAAKSVRIAMAGDQVEISPTAQIMIHEWPVGCMW